MSNESEKLRDCYLNSLEIADQLNIASIAFPNISTGIYGYPKDAAAEIAINTINDYDSDTIKLVQFVCYDEENFRLYNQKLELSKRSILDITSIEARLSKSTKGPWIAWIEGEDHDSGDSFIMTGIKKGEDIWGKDRGEDMYISGGTNEDLKFIAHAKQDIRSLIDEIKRINKGH